MRCDQFEERLNDVLDRRADPRRDASLATHWSSCRNCRDLAASYLAFTETAPLLRGPAAPAARQFSWSAAATTLLAAAAAAAWIVTYWAAPSAPAPQPTAATIATATPTTVPAATVPHDEPTVTQTATPVPRKSVPVVFDVARTTGPAVGLIRGTARGLDEALAMAAALPPPQELLEPMLFPEDGLLRQVEDRWVPAAGETIDALRSVFQAGEAPQL